MRFIEIRLDEKYTECTICHADTPIGYSIPMYENRVVDTTKSDEWAGMPVCEKCYYEYTHQKERL